MFPAKRGQALLQLQSLSSCAAVGTGPPSYGFWALGMSLW